MNIIHNGYDSPPLPTGRTDPRSWLHAGMIGRRVRRYKRKRDLREAKKKLAPFEKVQIDTKELRDIPEYWSTIIENHRRTRRFSDRRKRSAVRHSPFAVRPKAGIVGIWDFSAAEPPLAAALPRCEEGRDRGLPAYEYTARDVRTGATFVAFAHANDGTHAAAFATYVLEHLSRYGVEARECAVQTDNGSEYIGNVRKKSSEPSAFEAVLKNYEIRHARIPPRCSTWQSDVETVHRTIEDELYAIEPLRDMPELLGKSYAYQLFYNHFRKIRTRDNRSPREILEDAASDRYDPNILSLQPVLLDALLVRPAPGNHVPESSNPYSINLQ